MHTLTKDEFHLEAEPFLRKIFVHDNPFKEPFSSQVIGRTIIYDTSQEIYTLSGHSSSVLSVVISPNGQILASGSADGTIKLWDLTTWQEIRTLTSHNSSILSLAIDADGKILASGSADGTIKLWDVTTGQEIRTLDAECGFFLLFAFIQTDKCFLAVTKETEL
ncbi:MAG: hypothetical protein P2A85_12545 [Microcoleus anatoxicus]|uniref:WD40 repeat domain-containing protein n=1 Tax=Microcoleus anatoxicus TaxID=2705319 RepID=UPI00366AEA7E